MQPPPIGRALRRRSPSATSSPSAIIFSDTAVKAMLAGTRSHASLHDRKKASCTAPAEHEGQHNPGFRSALGRGGDPRPVAQWPLQKLRIRTERSTEDDDTQREVSDDA